MSEPGDFEIGPPQEGGESSQEGLSEAAKARFAAAAKAMKEQRKKEKQAKKKDDQVAKTIIQFLNDDRYAHLFVVISKLVARNCPSIFILGILSLINEGCLYAVKEYFSEHEEPNAHDAVDQLVTGNTLQRETNRKLIDWITHLQMILTHDAERILNSLMIDEKHLEGSVLQLTIFVLQEFFATEEKKDLPYEKAQPLTASILQTVFEPFLVHGKKKALESGSDEDSDETY